MNKPVPFALAMFTILILATFARSYYADEKIRWGIELASALGIAMLCYAFSKRTLK